MKRLNLFPLYVLIFVFCLGCFQITAQSSVIENQDEKILPPSEEKFEDSSELISPWRSGGCHPGTSLRQPGCYLVNVNQWQASHMMTIYNEDASIWFRFSIDRRDSDYFLQNMKKDFLPVATYPHQSPSAVILRLVGESPHWYKVETNENTEETKFIFKNDPAWIKTPWSHWLLVIYKLRIGKDARLLDKPDGKPIEEIENLSPSIVYFLELQGDWAKVETGFYGKTFIGWIRWRKDREILVRDIFGTFGFSGINEKELD